MRFIAMRRGSRTLLSASVLALAFAGTAAHAQPASTEAAQEDEQPGPDSGEAAPAQDDSVVIVSGTRIRTQQYDFANPVVSIDDEAIERSGITNVTDFLSDFPALVGSSDSNANSGANAGIGGVGLNLLDLRNLGTNRTLTLVDGRRHVAAVPGSASIDTNTIPVELIQRVDIVTGAAGAIYGADAVSGAVNFILRRDYEGLTLRTQAGISQEGDAEQYFAGLTAGTNFADDRGNIAVSLEYGREGRLVPEDRARLRSENFFSFVEDPDDSPDDPNVPDQRPVRDIRYFDSNRIGAIDTNLDFVPDFIGDGSPFDPGIYVGEIFQQGGSGTPVSTYGGELLPETERYIGNLLFSYELSDNIRFFAQGKYARVESNSEGQPTFDFTLFVPLDNAFLPDNVRQAAINDPDNQGFGVLVSRDNLDIGRRGEDNVRETYRGVIGVDGSINDNINFEVSYVYGRSDAEIHQTRTRFNDRFYAALDAVDEGEFLTGTPNGNIVCRSNLAPANQSNQPFANFFSQPFDFDAQALSFTPGPNSGCVPFNLFSENQSQAALDWMLTDAIDRSTIEQNVASASLSGTFGENIRLWADPIGFAVGAEYRHEYSESNPDPVNTTGLTFGNALFPEVGSFDVREVFGELRVPIVADRPFFHELTVNGAARYADYSTIGGALTYQTGAVWAPVRDIRFRGTYAVAVRAPNIGELFGPQNQDFQFIDDPCAPQRINDGTSFRAANCQAIFASLGLTPVQIADFTGDTSSNIPGLSGGNPNLAEEEATTWTAGVILRPRFVPGLTLSADYYDVRIENAVSLPSVNTIVNLCVDSPTIDNVFCDSITRNPGTNAAAPGVISGFIRQPQNVAQFTTKGVDFSASYRFSPGLGNVTVGLVGNYLDELTFIGTPGGSVIDSTGVAGAPEWQLNLDLNWTIDDVSVTYGVNYWSETLRFSREAVAADPDIVAPEYLYFSERFTHDVQVAFNASEQFRFYVGVNNLFNQEPDIGSTFYPVSGVGRFFYAGVRTTLPSF